MKILKEKATVLSVTVRFDEDELDALVTLFGKMTADEIVEFGVSSEQAELIYLIYRELSNYVDDK